MAVAEEAYVMPNISIDNNEVQRRFLNLPSLNEIERMARLQLQDAQKFGHNEGIQQAQRVLERIQDLKASGALPIDKPIGQALKSAYTSKQYADALTSTYNRKNRMSAGFDPISYMKEFFARGPWPYGTKTLSEKAAEAEAQQEAERMAWEREKAYMPYQYLRPEEQLQQLRWEAEWPYRQAQYQYNLNKPYYKPEDAQTSDLTGVFFELGTGYKSPIDFKNDLMKYASIVSNLIGTKNFQQLLDYLDKEQEKFEAQAYSEGRLLAGSKKQVEATPWGIRYIPGMKSPLEEWLKRQGYIKQNMSYTGGGR